MDKILCISFCILLNILFVKGETYTSIINTASGPVRGFISTTIENKEYAAFKGIPYAKPPVGHLRFKPPVPVDAWTSVYNATTEGSACTQPSLDGTSVHGSEDCLFINVYTPHTNFDEFTSKPVMVWIHGGAYSLGDSGQAFYGPDFIVGEDVILVAFNYRLGAFGFLNLEHENASGNCALKDQNLALKWVKKNIAYFGGNPDKITLFGESAGSVFVDLHILSDMSVGLFSQSISMSGSTLNLYWGIQKSAEAVENGFKLGSRLGTNTRNEDALLKTLYSASAADIATASNSLGFVNGFQTYYRKSEYTVQEKFLTKCAPEKFKDGNYTKGPHMMGFTADESLLFVGGKFNVAKSALHALKTRTSKIPILSAITNGIENLTNGATYGLGKRITDLLFVLGIDTKQKLMSRNNDHPIYYYRFSFQSNYSFHKVLGVDLEGAAHGDDLPYLFNVQKILPPSNQSDIVTTRQRMVKLWTNFAKYGNPTPDSSLGVTWPDSRLSGTHLEIGENLITGPRPVGSFIKMLQFFKLGDKSSFNDC